MSISVDQLAGAFNDSCATLGTHTAALSFLDRASGARLDCDASGQSIAGHAPLALSASCMIKPYTATLVLRGLQANDTSVDTELRAIGHFGGDRFAKWSGITLRHLLDDTHGLDDPSLDSCPFTSDGRIDIAKLYERTTSVRPLHEPGAFNSYSDVGLMLAGAVLEQLQGRPFTEILKSSALDPQLELLQDDTSLRALDSDARVCPSTGGPLLLSSADLLRLAVSYLNAAPATRERVFGRVVPPAGWTPNVRGVCLGFNAHQDGWFGYNATTTAGGSMCLRFNFERQVAIAVASADANAVRLMAGACDGVVPGAEPTPKLQFLSAAQLETLNLDACVGTYECAALRCVVTRSAAGMPLKLKLSNRNPSIPLMTEDVERPLRLSPGHVFFTAPPLRRAFTFGQFLMPQNEAPCEYLWSGRRIWRRVA